MTKEVLVHWPQVSVVVRKVVNRRSTVAQGVATSDRVQHSEGTEIDLTPFLGSGSTIMVRRSVRGPDTGVFSVSFPDQMHPLLADSIYGLVEPMDAIEIRMSRDPSSGPLPLVFRGFVGEVRRSESISASGPQRRVTITGHDYMKILHIMRLFYLPTMIPGQLLLTAFSPFLNYGIDSTNYDTPAAFLKRIVDQSLNPFIAEMRKGSGGDKSPVLDLVPDAVDSDTPAAVAPFGVQGPIEGSVYELLARFLDVGAWNELYVEDREDGPALVFRPAPFRTAEGGFVQGGAYADEVQASASDIISIEVSRTDQNVANYYWVEVAQMSLVQQPLLQLMQTANPTPALDGYQNSDKAIYGMRLMRQATTEVPRYDGQNEAAVQRGNASVIETANEKRRVLVESNKDNVVLESGEATLKGRETLKPGSYLRIDRGGFVVSYYVPDVEHVFTIGGSFVTNVTLDRGTGFIERLKRGISTPAALAEATIGGVYAG